jgi:hypothetical protein
LITLAENFKSIVVGFKNEADGNRVDVHENRANVIAAINEDLEASSLVFEGANHPAGSVFVLLGK